ncbi:hypothetical protein L873DRAFT_1832135 [Choiromyces venosus 120613-1]|uniref:Diphosphomevalonate decarboxylase-like N-terminal domain-containing protein n=1 Tax=Choiromyces venosus 120613-1 TaxID=1336337 RepID=A0A3N4IT38_9PEZI|nr:hypothetical protein L873DRAFT_1832135 [Choiromyces venosus 120613-1]
MADKIYSASTTAPVNIAVAKSNSRWLNGEAQDVSGARQTACFRGFKILRRNHEDANPFLPQLSKYCVHAVSEDNFPTAAGLAFTAASFAAFAQPIEDLYELPEQGSRSGCRSLFCGYVAWEMGQAVDGSNSYSAEVAPAPY